MCVRGDRDSEARFLCAEAAQFRETWIECRLTTAEPNSKAAMAVELG
jgi:hypothetical protein